MSFPFGVISGFGALMTVVTFPTLISSGTSLIICFGVLSLCYIISSFSTRMVLIDRLREFISSSLRVCINILPSRTVSTLFFLTLMPLGFMSSLNWFLICSLEWLLYFPCYSVPVSPVILIVSEKNFLHPTSDGSTCCTSPFLSLPPVVIRWCHLSRWTAVFFSLRFLRYLLKLFA